MSYEKIRLDSKTRYNQKRNTSKLRLKQIKIYHPSSKSQRVWCTIDMPQPPSPRFKYLMVIVPQSMDPEIFGGKLPVTYAMTAQILNVKVSSVRRLIAAKELKAVGTSPGLVFFEDIVAYLERKAAIRYSPERVKYLKEMSQRAFGTKNKLSLSTGSRNIEFNEDSISIDKPTVKHYTKEELDMIGYQREPEQDFGDDLRPQSL